MATDTKAIRRYHAGIERALGLFDSTSEWADFIAYLSRLFRSLQDPPPDADLPFKSTIAKHLAQCLKPSLPSGVHQKALDVYGLIFSIIGPTGLAQDLPLYLPGLSHTLAFASLATRPQLLSLYDEYILSLSARDIRPAIRALILSLLPGIEEETSEDFEATLATFNHLRRKFADHGQEEIFWQNLFLASITSASRRAGVLVYLTRSLPRLGSSNTSGGSNDPAGSIHSTAAAVTRPEPGLLVRCFATGLQDEQPLIQRGFLDLLVTHLPLDAPIFRSGGQDSDLDVLVSSAVTVVLRRDMSLNRRLWTWFTGTDSKTSTAPDGEVPRNGSITSPVIQQKPDTRSSDYFTLYGLHPLVRSLQAMLTSVAPMASSQAQPFRVALSLMDRWEIGGPVVESVFVPLIRSLEAYQSTAPTQEAFDEVFRSANVFFDGIEGRLIASQIIKLLQHDEHDLILFIISNFNLEDDEMMKRHVPLICLFVSDELHGSTIRSNTSDMTLAESGNALKLAQILEELLKLMGNGVLVDSEATLDPEVLQNWRSQILRFYEQSALATKSIMLPLPKQILTAILLQEICEICIYCLSSKAPMSTLLPRIAAIIDRTGVLVEGCATMNRVQFPDQVFRCLPGQTVDEQKKFETATSIARVITGLQRYDSSSQILTTSLLCRSLPLLIRNLWALLQSSTPQYHVEVVETLWRIHRISRDLKLVESTILAIMTSDVLSKHARDENVLRFATIWAHSRAVSKQIMGAHGLQGLHTGEEGLEILRQPLLFMIDRIDVGILEHSISLWTRSLNSLVSAFRVTFEIAGEAVSDQQIIGLTLKRLSQLVELAKDNPALWKCFAEQHEQSGAVLEFCSSIISKELFAGSLGVEALYLIQRIVKIGNFSLEEDFIRLLITQLASSQDNNDLQSALLEALQNMFLTFAGPTLSEILLSVLLEGISSPRVDYQLEKWIALLCNVVPSLHPSTLMANLLKITSTLCGRIETYFALLQQLYMAPVDVQNDHDQHQKIVMNPERSISSLLSGTEYVLARAHHQASSSSERNGAATSGAKPDLPSARSSANDHLTVVLCMQDALKACTKLWLWRSSARSPQGYIDIKSMHYMSAKLRARSRRILENLIEAEPQECLETLMGVWADRQAPGTQQSQVLELLQTLDGARPKFMMPATFNAIYNRTNPAALDNAQRSSLSVDITAFDLIAFLHDYTGALEDDLLDEIWTDCTTFLKEILANPMPHRQILLRLLEFTAVLCRKMENTNFGEESRMRKELADLCARLFTAIFTIKPYGLDSSGSKTDDVDAVFDRSRSTPRMSSGPGNALQVVHEILPDLGSVLSQSDRLTTVYTGIATNMTGPLLRSKQFPSNISPELLALLQTISSAQSATKAWKKDIQDAFNDTKFFQGEAGLAERGWFPLLRQLVLQDKSLMPELLNRLTPPAAAGLMFGVGAAAARIDADKKTQLTLRRIIMLLLSMEMDSFVPQLQQLFVKLEELLSATPESSPSSSTRSDIYMVFRAILLSFSTPQLATLWPILDDELRDLCTDMIAAESGTSTLLPRFTITARIQGAKLLDLLLLIKPDDFQLHEWLFVTDTVDAIYPPDTPNNVALADQIGETASSATTSGYPLELQRTTTMQTARKPWLASEDSRSPDRFPSLLSSFFSHLSIRAFEDNYGLQKIDLEACRRDLIADIFVVDDH